MSCSKAAARAPGRSSGPWARVIPTELPRRAGLTIRRGIAGARGERLELGEHARRVARPAPGGDLAPVDDRQAEAADEALEERLVHADRRGRDAGAGVRQVGRLEQRLDGAVLAERPVEGDEHDRPGIPGGEPLEDRAARQRTLGPERSRVVEVGRGQRASAPPAVAAPRRAAATSGRRGRSRPGRPRSPARPRAAATAEPDTIETSCSADGPPSRTTTGRRGRSSPPPPAASRPSRRGRRPPRRAGSRVRRSTSARTRSAQAAQVGRTALAVVDQEVGVLLADRGAADPEALQAGRRRSAPRPSAGSGLRNHDAGARGAQRLVLLAPALDLLEALLDLGGRRRLELERRAEDDLRGDPVGRDA